MRHLFVPACLCLMTWSSSTGTGPASLDPPRGSHSVVAKAPAPILDIADEASHTAEAWPMLEAANRRARNDTQTAIAAANIDVPRQHDLRGFLEPQSSLDPHGEPSVIREAEGPPAPPPKPVVHRSRQEVCETLASAAETNNLPAPFFIRLLLQESGFRPGVVSPVGAQGVAQFMPGTAAEMGLDNPFDPLQAIPASARLLRNLFDRFGNLGLAAAAYNAGPRRIQDWLEKKGKLPDETRGYVKTITGREADTWKEASATGIEGKLPRIAPCQRQAGLHAWNGPDRIPMPPPSPLTAGAAVAANDTTPSAAPSKTPARIAAKGEGKTSVRIASAGEAPAVAEASAKGGPARSATRGGRVTATITVRREATNADGKSGVKTDGKPAAKTADASVQLAARKGGGKNGSKSSGKSVAQKSSPQKTGAPKTGGKPESNRPGKPLRIAGADK